MASFLVIFFLYLNPMKIAVIGGGAAGFMAAITAQSFAKHAKVELFEKSNKVLSKVKISGGGRCNVTHHCLSISELSKNYPRGGTFLKKSFELFNTKDTIKWFEEKGVKLKIESDNRMFPTSDNSQTIVDCLINTLLHLNITINYNSKIEFIKVHKNGYNLKINNGDNYFDKVIIASGGSPKIEGFNWLNDLNIDIVSPVPSLFTFNMPNEKITELMGLVAPNTNVHIQESKHKHSGPLLITHWGMSGPSILKISAWMARELAQKNYNFKLHVNWANLSEENYLSIIRESKQSQRMMSNKNPFELPNRLWLYLLSKINIDSNILWNRLDKKNSNRLLNVLLNDCYEVNGKTTFKEEFVTCGGIALTEVNPLTMESKKYKGLYFCGEILDIDGITGGFNFQSAWTTAFISGKNSVL